MTSIWDYMKRGEQHARPQSVDRTEDRRLVIQWEDGAKTAVAVREVRVSCQCAACVDELTRQRILDVSKVPQDIDVTSMETVGNYALRIVFTDGHDSGIYEWQRLRRMG